MQMFDYNSPEEPQYAAYRSDKNWTRIYSLLREGFWHVTTSEGWNAIRESGAIKPNLDGRFPMRFEFETQRSYGYKNNYVALFDFTTATEEETIRVWDRAWPVLRAGSILIQLKRESLLPKIIPNAANFPPRENREVFGCIPFCEAWYPDDIPISAIAQPYRLLLVPGFGDFHVEAISLDTKVEPAPKPPPQTHDEILAECLSNLFSRGKGGYNTLNELGECIMAGDTSKELSVSVGTMTNSVIQQNSPGAKASIRLVTQDEKNAVDEALNRISSFLDLLPISEDDRQEMRDDIQTAEAQLNAKKPKAGIISTCLTSLLQKLTVAASGPLATQVVTSVQWSIEKLTSILQGM